MPKQKSIMSAAAGDRAEWLALRRAKLVLDQLDSPKAFCAFYKANFGPTIAANTALEPDPDRTSELDRDFLEFAASHGHSRSDNSPVYEFEYLLAVARRNGALLGLRARRRTVAVQGGQPVG